MKTSLRLQLSLITMLVVFLNIYNISGLYGQCGDQNTDCCLWPGVSCDQEGHVLVLDLDDEAISGGVENSSSLLDLQYFKKLNLSNNDLNPVKTPTEIYKLSNLTYLNLSDAGFIGQICMELSTLTHSACTDVLEQLLDVAAGIYERDSCACIVYRHHRLPAPFIMLDLVVSYLCVWFVPLGGIISDMLSTLIILDFKYDCDPQKGQGTSLIRSDSCSAFQLQKFPDRRNQSRLYALDLSDNNIEGEIPNWVWSVGNGSLQYVNLSSNLLEFLEKPYYISTTLRVIDLHSNNKLTGQIPSSICKLRQLQLLDMSNNAINSKIPPCLFQKIHHLKVLNLGRNKLSGLIPDTFPLNCNLQVLALGSNLIEGKVPTSLERCAYLEVFDIGNNKIQDIYSHLSGRIPDELVSLTFLSFLNLSFNQLYGRIPRGNQFQTFSADSFEGNTRLCDFPLKKMCSDTKATASSQFSSRHSEHETVDGKYISFVLESSEAFGIATWLLLHRRRYNELVDRLLFRILGQHKKSDSNKNPRRARISLHVLLRRS
ncbi:hypothetical protein RND71_003500 [Anisodus tanguticus]|uniref:Uncharacterized protein n=1 Tax=Anisodus tanguticus TaxID=243964 RepID=A0AAE1SUP9_9SOLA|nr:hypothetical protein RND71_003500 [Anisodus tanguticus]